MEESGSISLYMPDARLDADVSGGILVSAFNCLLPLMMELGRCDSTLIEITSAIEKQFSQRLLSSYRSPPPPPRPQPSSIHGSGRDGRASAGGNSADGKGHFSQRPSFHYMLSLPDG